MPAAKATDTISPEARALMARGFADGKPVRVIVQSIQDATGEILKPRTVARRAQEWRIEVRRRQGAKERMQDLVAAMKNGNMDASEMIQALAMDRLVDAPEALTGADPIKVQSLSLASEELRLKRQALLLRERAIQVNEKKLSLLEAREQRAIAALSAEHGEQLTPEQRIEQIREIYGLEN